MKKIILVVDDDASVRASVNKVLRAAGYEVVQAAGGMEALVRLKAHAFDLVLLDIGLPNHDGWEICKHIVRHHPSLPIIVITGQEGQLYFALAAGATALMEKPLDAQRLLHLLEELLSSPKDSAHVRSKEKFYHFAA